MRREYSLALFALLAASGCDLCLAPPASLSAGYGPQGPIGQPPSGVGLTWSDASSCETGFEIERAQSAGDFSPLATTAADVTRYLDTSAVATDGAYCYGCSYRIRAAGEGGARSDWSNVAVAPGSPPAGP